MRRTPTRAALERDLSHARAAVILAEDHLNLDQAQAARDECDRLLDQLNTQHDVDL